MSPPTVCCRRSLRAPYEDFGAGFLLFVRAMVYMLAASLLLLACAVRPLGGPLPMVWLLVAAAGAMALAYRQGWWGPRVGGCASLQGVC